MVLLAMRCAGRRIETLADGDEVVDPDLGGVVGIGVELIRTGRREGDRAGQPQRPVHGGDPGDGGGGAPVTGHGAVGRADAEGGLLKVELTHGLMPPG